VWKHDPVKSKRSEAADHQGRNEGSIAAKCIHHLLRDVFSQPGLILYGVVEGLGTDPPLLHKILQLREEDGHPAVMLDDVFKDGEVLAGGPLAELVGHPIPHQECEEALLRFLVRTPEYEARFAGALGEALHLPGRDRIVHGTVAVVVFVLGL